jgi:hypothetical protein
MNKLIASALVFSSLSAVAGDGGFKLISCISDSHRSTLVIREDNFSQTTIPYTVVLGIDGDYVTHAPEFKLNDDFEMVPVGCEEECKTVKYQDKKSLKVTEGESTLLDVSFSGSTATVKKGFYDPRPGYSNYPSEKTLTLNCKTYIQGP